MALYSEVVMDHFMNPRNVGVIEDADGVGQVGNAKCASWIWRLLCETSPVWIASCPATEWLMEFIKNFWRTSRPTTSRTRTNDWPAKD